MKVAIGSHLLTNWNSGLFLAAEISPELLPVVGVVGDSGVVVGTSGAVKGFVLFFPLLRLISGRQCPFPGGQRGSESRPAFRNVRVCRSVDEPACRKSAFR